jgi:tetracycline repressor-like protein
LLAGFGMPQPLRYLATASGTNTATMPAAPRFPHTLSAVDALFSGGPDERFEFGLDLIIRGIETYARQPSG